MLLQPHFGPDGDEYVTRSQAAKLMGVAPNTINTWEKRDYLKRVPGLPPRKALYLLSDVIEAEKAARDAALAHCGTRVVRHFVDEDAA
jgi:hypothetical protein